MMVHPAGADLRGMDIVAIHRCLATYRGESAHAAAAPERGRNALDAAVLGYVNIAALRQHIGPAERIHGVFTDRSEEHTSELQSLMRISYAVFCLNKKKNK